MSANTIEATAVVESKPYEGEQCDACNARAFWTVFGFGASELSFCNHHYNKNAKHFEAMDKVQITSESR